MDTFDSLSQRAKTAIVASAFFLLSLSVGFIVFGENLVHEEQEQWIEHAMENAKASVLFSAPQEIGH